MFVFEGTGTLFVGLVTGNHKEHRNWFRVPYSHTHSLKGCKVGVPESYSVVWIGGLGGRPNLVSETGVSY